MTFSLQELARRKWFVPVIVVLLFLIAISSIKSSSEAQESSITMEDKLEEICRAISGAERTTVMITYEEYTTETFWNNSNEKSKISGIVVVCDRGDDPNVQLKILNALKALFDLPSTRITITDRY